MTRETRILILEDQPTDAELEIRELRQAQLDFEVEWVETKETFLNALTEFEPDVIISDYGLPQFNGLEALRLLKEQNLDIPFILCTGTLTEEVAVQCMKEGATDYILKTSLTRLPSAVLNALEKNESRRAKEEAAAALRRSEEKFRSIIETTSDWIWAIDLESRSTYNNPFVETILGYSPEELNGKSILPLMHEKDREKIERVQQTFIAEKCGWTNFVCRWRHKDGSIRYLESNAVPVLDDDGELIGYRGANRDITERRQDQEALQKNLSLLASTFEATAEGILAVDLNNNIITFNKKFVEMWSIPEEVVNRKDTSEVLNHILPQLNNPGDFSNKIRQSLEQPEVISFSTWELSDGRIYERYSQPQVLDGKTVGRVLGYRDITERKKNENALRDNEQKYRELIENANDVLYTLDLTGGFTSLNRAGEQITGYTRAEAFRMNIADVISPKDAERVRDRIARNIKGAGLPNFELEIIAKDGGIVTLDISSRLILQDGVPVGVQGIGRDITERKRTETALRESEYKLRTLLTSMSEGLVQVDLADRIEYVNDRFCELTGFDREELLGKLTFDVIFDEEGSRLVRNANRDRFKGISDQYGTRLKTKSGEMLWVIVGGSPLVDAAGKIIGKMGVFTDITERKRTEIALRESEYKLRTLLTSMNEGLLQVDEKDSIVFVNKCFCEMVGYSEEELIGKNWSRLMLDNEGSEFIREVNKRRREGISDRYELCLKKKSGETIYVMVGGVPILEAEGVVSGSMGVFTDITERKRIEEQLLHDAFHDGLTGLANRALFMDHLRLTIERGKSRHSNLYAVLFLDFDRFKFINDSLGHAEGDKLLQHIARRLESTTRTGDLVARLGGDEFVVLLSELVEDNDAVEIAERIQNNLKNPFDLSGNEIVMSASIGIAPSTAGHKRPEDMVRDADIAMYRAKAKGKARYEIFDQAMHENASKQLRLETEMRQALEREEFQLHYQPIINLETETLVGFEALVRWKHPERGMIPPFEFIGAAEENGLILPLGQWILQESCRQLRRWQDANPAVSHLTVSVNLSSKQFSQADFAEQIAATIERTKLDPRCLKLEITESHIMENSEQAIVMMNRLRALGVELSLDDFGTGYSSLSYLHRLPVSYLKIDRSFVMRMAESEENSEIVSTIIKLAQNLKMKVVAEGIETAEQLAHLKSLRCEFGQGYFFSKPLEAEAAEKFIRENAENSAFIFYQTDLNSELNM